MPVHYCLGLEPKEFASAADPWNKERLGQAVKNLVRDVGFVSLKASPTYAWTTADLASSHVIAELEFNNHTEARRFHDALKTTTLRDPHGKLLFGFGQDPIIDAQDVWSPIGPGGGIFGDRSAAEELTGTRNLGSATGKGVNVLIVDRGLDRGTVAATTARMARRHGLKMNEVPPLVLGWTRYEWEELPDKRRIRRSINPGATGSEHATMIARNVLAVAPEATIWDAPLLPTEDQQDAPPRLSSVGHLFHWIKQAVRSQVVRSWDTKENGLADISVTKPWIIVNAWGVMDPESDTDPDARNYADDPDHLLVNDVGRLGQAGIDVVFAAGNCGEPCPDPRCGNNDTGPCRSIYGLNGHPCVLTVGAVRADGVAVALSAQGPGRLAAKGSRDTDYTHELRAIEKPDLCAPSHFRESDDANEFNTGTSAACGFAAGVIAALRSVPEVQDVSPDILRMVLRETASRPPGTCWDPRLGYGVIHAARALQELRKGIWPSQPAQPLCESSPFR